MNRFKITGLGSVSRAGGNCSELVETLANAGRNLRMPSEAEPFYRVKIADEKLLERDIASDLFMPNKLALLAVDEALEMAGINRGELIKLRVGICIGSTVGCTNFQEQFAKEFYSGQKPPPEPFHAYDRNNTALFLSRYFKTRGPVMVLSNACTSGADAIGTASDWLAQDRCDVVICGGTEFILERMYFGFRSLMLTSQAGCRPFDKKRTGLTLSDGAGILILEKANSTRRALAHLKGYGVGSDAYHATAPHPEARGLRVALRSLERRTGIELEKIDFINAHATGSEASDLVEGQFLREHLAHTIISSTKGYTGHSLGASAAIDAVITVLCLRGQWVPKTIGFENVDPRMNVKPTTELVRGKFSEALSLALGFGGTNNILHFGVADAD